MADLTVNPLTPASSTPVTPVTANSTPTGIPPVPTFSATNPVTASPDATTMNNFKAANPGLTPNAQDVSIMNGAKAPVPMPTVSPTANYQAVTAPSTPLQQPTPSIIATTQATAPQTQGMAQTALQTTQDYIAKQQVTPEQATSNNIFDSLKNSLMPSDGSAGISSREMQTRADLGQQYNTIGITQQLATLTPQINAISQQIQANNQQAAAAKLSILSSPLGGLTQADYSGRQTEIDRNNAIKNLSLSAQSNVLASQALILQGNLDGASKAIELAITQRYGAEEAKIKDQQALMTLNQPRLETANAKATANQTLLINSSLADLANQREQAKTLVGNVNTMITNGMIPTDKVSDAYKIMGQLSSGSLTLADAYKQLGMTQDYTSQVGGGGSNSGSLANALVKQESGGKYDALGAMMTTGQNAGFQALGKYQIMPNLWFSAIGLNANSAEDKKKFLETPALQDELFNHILSTIGAKYNNNPAKTAAAYYGGDLGAQNYGTPAGDTQGKYVNGKPTGQPSVNEYVKSVLGKMQAGQVTTNEYGDLANTTFNPNLPVDRNANTYLTTLFTGKMPQAGDLGIFGRTAGATQKFQDIQNRARNMYFEATGQPLPNVKDIQNAQTLINGNNKLVNTLNIADSTVGKNFALAISNIDKNGINQNSQPINAFLDYIKTQMGDPATAQYLAQNATVSNEVSSLLAVKNAGGTTVHDKLESAGLVPKNASEEQQRAVLKTLLQEAENAKGAVSDQTTKLYAITDPLHMNANNPSRINAPVTSSNSVDLTKFDKK